MVELAGRYRLEAIVGSGALGEVWKAEDLLHDRPVAIKFLKPEVAASDPVLLRKFRQEARIGAVLGHRGIVRVDDFGEYEGRWYLVMEFLPGRNLQEEIEDHPHGLPLPWLLSLGAQIADALAAAHARRIVHRDLKPANIMLAGPERAPKICDFGIAHLAESATLNTLTGKSAGTPVYMAPEQWLGQPVDARTDLYALGGTLYTLLTGAPAFAGSLLALKAQHLDTRPAPPGKRRPGLPAGLESLVLQLLAKDPADRPSNATEVAERLLALTEPTTTTRPEAERPRVERPRAEDPHVERPQAEPVPAPAPVPAPPTLDGTEEQTQDGTQERTRERTPRRAGRPTRRAVLLSLGATALLVPAGYLLDRLAHSGQVGDPLAGQSDEVESLAFSPDGGTLVSAGGLDDTIRLWNVAARRQAGSLLADAWIYSVAFSRDGKTLASGHKDNTVRLWNAATRKQIGSLTGHTDYISSVAFSPDGKVLASGGMDHTVRLWSVAGRIRIGILAGHTDYVYSVAFSPDGKTLASGSIDRTVRLWNVADQSQIGSFTGHTSAVNSVAFSPDGDTLASGGQDHTVRLWDIAGGSQIGDPLTGHGAEVKSVAFSPDRKTLASGGLDAIRLWDVADPAQVRETRTGYSSPVHSLAFSPDGNTLAFGGKDHAVRLWRLRAQ